MCSQLGDKWSKGTETPEWNSKADLEPDPQVHPHREAVTEKEPRAETSMLSTQGCDLHGLPQWR